MWHGLTSHSSVVLWVQFLCNISRPHSMRQGFFCRCIEYSTAVNFKMCPLRIVLLLKYVFFKKNRKQERHFTCGLRLFLYCVGKEIVFCVEQILKYFFSSENLFFLKFNSALGKHCFSESKKFNLTELIQLSCQRMQYCSVLSVEKEQKAIATNFCTISLLLELPPGMCCFAEDVCQQSALS